MIGCLTGTIKLLEAPLVILEVHGIGYEIETSLSTFCQLKLNETSTLWTHFVVREDAQLLYGFSSTAEKNFFRFLLKVNGVGPKLALAILSGMSTDMLIQSIEMQDISTLTRIPGVGKKTAERLIVELRDRISSLSSGESLGGAASPIQIGLTQPSPVAEAEAALVSLGYKPVEAQRAIGMVKAEFSETPDLIRAALKRMMKN